MLYIYQHWYCILVIIVNSFILIGTYLYFQVIFIYIDSSKFVFKFKKWEELEKKYKVNIGTNVYKYDKNYEGGI